MLGSLESNHRALRLCSLSFSFSLFLSFLQFPLSLLVYLQVHWSSLRNKNNFFFFRWELLGFTLLLIFIHNMQHTIILSCYTLHPWYFYLLTAFSHFPLTLPSPLVTTNLFVFKVKLTYNTMLDSCCTTVTQYSSTFQNDHHGNSLVA